MPILDMSLDKLREYQGRNPRPADFDAFWEASLAEMRRIDPAPICTPSWFSTSYAECYDMTFTSTKGARIYAKLARPKALTAKAPAVLFFHGLSGSSTEWNALMSYVAEGFVVAAMDCRGQGGHSDDSASYTGTTFTTPFVRGVDGAPEGLYYRDVYLDCAMLARIVMGLDYVDETRVGCTGGSQGGGLTIACASLVPEIKLCAPMYPYLSDYRRVWDMDLAKAAYEGMNYYFRHFDPTHEREEEFFEKLGYIDIQHLAPRIRAEVLMFTGLMDNVCPPSTQFAAYNKITAKKNVEIYPDFGHETLPHAGEKIFMFLTKGL